MPKNVSIHTNIVLKKDGKVVQTYSGRLKSRVLAFSKELKKRRNDFDEGVCTIIYRARPLVFNSFEFHSPEELSESYKTDTEQSLLDYVLRGRW